MSLVQGQRDPDEFLYLDVDASRRLGAVSVQLITSLARRLRVPFAVGGGVSSEEAAAELFSGGADKVVVGKAARLDSTLLPRLASRFGSQSIVATVDALSPNRRIDRCELEFLGKEVAVVEMIRKLQDQGAGEIILTNVELDGTMFGIDAEGISQAAHVAEVPLVVGSGVAGIDCFRKAFDEGAAGVFAGALFQFSSATPETVRRELLASGYQVRQKIT